jgi:competence protein ComGB
LDILKNQNMTDGCMMMNRFNTKWKVEEQALFLKRTGELLARGYPLSEAIESVSYYLHGNKKEQMEECLMDLKEGYPLYEILSKLDFNHNLIGYVYFAEQHGGLSEAFLDGSSMILKREKDLKRLLRLLYYPLLLMSVTLFLFIFVERILLPKFTSLFQTMQLETNFFTKIVYFLADVGPIVFLVFLSLFLLSLFYYYFYFRKKNQLVQKESIVRLPIVGRVFKLLYTHYFSVQLSYLLTGGISVFEALSLFEKNMRQPFYKEIGIEMKKRLTTGERLETILASLPFFEHELSRIVKHGQENGKLGQELYFFSQFCLANLESLTEKWLKIIQPLLYSLIGLMIVSMYLAVLLPMFHLLDGI